MLFGNGFGFWNTMPMRRRTSVAETSGRRDRRRGSVTLAGDARARDQSFIRLKQRSTVVLPQPDGPMNAVIWFLRICRVTSRTARNAP